MKKKILLMGLPGSGKTTLASKLAPLINAKWINADSVRKDANDWDFSDKGRKRQAKRMSDISEEHRKSGYHVIADFVCPTPETRDEFKPDYIIWVDTIKKGRFEDTNKIFVPPKNFNFRVTSQNADLWASKIADQFKKKD